MHATFELISCIYLHVFEGMGILTFSKRAFFAQYVFVHDGHGMHLAFALISAFAFAFAFVFAFALAIAHTWCTACTFGGTFGGAFGGTFANA